MNTVEIEMEVPDRLAARIDELVNMGLFDDSNALARYALIEFVRRNSFDLMRRFPAVQNYESNQS